jgi:uncharacterized protein (TIGR03437 family)
VNVTMILSVPVGTATSVAGQCTPTQLAPTQTGLPNNFSQPASWPASLAVTVLNNCGVPVSNGQVTVSFSNGDPPVALIANPGTGVYTGTWIPGTVSGQVTATATVTAAGFTPAGAAVSGAVTANSAPALVPGGTLHVYNPLIGAAIAQGTILQIYGSNLSGAATLASSVPLPVALGGTSVTIGGIPAPLYYVGPGQIDAQLPYELAPGNSYQVVVNNNGALSMPGEVQVASATPGFAAFASGQIVAQHADYSLVSESSPAAPGEYLVVYLSGLGQTNHPVADGAPAPGSPLSTPLVAPVLTLNGVSVPIAFAGLTPGDVGLYQMNFQVPANTPNGDLPLVVSQGGVTGNPTVLPVHN